MNNEPIQIILADDDESDRVIFKEALEELKVKTTVHTLNDGEELMNYLNNENNIIPFLLFLDLNMPRKDGLQCLKEIRSSEKLKNIIVAIYSTSSYQNDIEETFKSGANVYIKKPNDYSSLKQVLNKVVNTAYAYGTPPFNITNFLFKI